MKNSFTISCYDDDNDDDDDDVIIDMQLQMLDINVKQSSQDGVTPLHLACRYNSGDVTQYLLFRQADVNVTDAKGRTPLHYATRRGNDLVTKVCNKLVRFYTILVFLLLAALSLSTKD